MELSPAALGYEAGREWHSFQSPAYEANTCAVEQLGMAAAGEGERGQAENSQKPWRRKLARVSHEEKASV